MYSVVTFTSAVKPRSAIQYLRIPGALGSKNTPAIYLGKRQICFFSTAILGESTMAIPKTVTSKTTENRKYQHGCKTESTHVSESMTDIVKIPTANIRFSTTASSKIKCS